MYDGAFYLAGYSVELALKAKVCERICVPNLFDDANKEVNSIEGISDIRKVLKTHNLVVLLILSGLKDTFEEDAKANDKLMQSIILLFNKWNESARYNTVGFTKKENITRILNSLSGDNGLLLWITEH
jgi:hypothetical protein